MIDLQLPFELDLFGLAPAKTALVCLVCLCLWAAQLVLFIGLSRGLALLTGRSLTDFPGGQKHGGEMYWRLNRAHANICENLPIFGGVILAGYVSNLVTPQFAQV